MLKLRSLNGLSLPNLVDLLPEGTQEAALAANLKVLQEKLGVPQTGTVNVATVNAINKALDTRYDMDDADYIKNNALKIAGLVPDKSTSSSSSSTMKWVAIGGGTLIGVLILVALLKKR